MNGWLIIDKPSCVTSADVVRVVKRCLGKNVKVGHAGTLDPFATGVLLIAVGEATKLVSFAMNKQKEYTFQVKWGEERDTNDITGSTIKVSKIRPNKESIKGIVTKFLGEIDQVPPYYSAIKVNGKRAYELSRKKEKFDLVARKVFLKELSILNHNDEYTDFHVRCGKGFYIRSLARDIAYELNTYGYVTKLRRNSIGKFFEKDALDSSFIKEGLHNNDIYGLLLNGLLHINTVLDDIPVQRVTKHEADALRFGQKVRIEKNSISQKEIAAMLQGEEKLIAICVNSDNCLVPKRVFNI